MKSYYERHNKRREEIVEEKVDPNHTPASINIEPCEMESLVKTKLATTNQLNAMVLNIFKPHCPEIEGCWVDVGNEGTTCFVYFSFIDRPEKDLGDKGMFKIVQRRGEKHSDSAYADIERYNNRIRRASMFELTDNGKEVLSEFVARRHFVGDPRRNKINWNKVVTEVADSNIYNASRTYLKVEIDLVRVFQKVYGKTSKDGDDYLYMINPSRPITTYQGSNGNMYTSNWLFTICQMNRKVLNDVMNDSGLTMNTAGGLNMYRG